jgi:hypothetical protein
MSIWEWSPHDAYRDMSVSDSLGNAFPPVREAGYEPTSKVDPYLSNLVCSSLDLTLILRSVH